MFPSHTINISRESSTLQVEKWNIVEKSPTPLKRGYNQGMKPQKTIGEIVTAARTRAGLTRQEVAERSGVSLGYVRDLENDRFQSLSIRTVGRLKNVLPSLDVTGLLNPAPPERRTLPHPTAGRPRTKVTK